MTPTRILDLFCGAGGAAMGYHRAFPGAEIVGVDLSPQPRFPFHFVQGDALTFPLDGFDIVHASPPCHDHSTVSGRGHKFHGEKHGTGWMLAATIERLSGTAPIFVVENVEGARWPEGMPPFRLCGSSFLLDVQRHRRFVCNVPIPAPPCAHGWQTPRFVSLNYKNRVEGKLARVVGVHGHLQYPGERAIRQAAMGIDWMNDEELTQAIPPAFTEWIGLHL